MNIKDIFRVYNKYTVTFLGRKNGYITQAERNKARKRNRKKKK
jgi:hypothetical protein